MLRFVNFSLDRPLRQAKTMIFLILACSAAGAYAQPREARDADMQSCRFISRVSGDSGYGKNSGWQGLARYAALRRAESLGATDIVWERFTPVGAFNGVAEAKAFACDVRVAQATKTSAPK